MTVTAPAPAVRPPPAPPSRHAEPMAAATFPGALAVIGGATALTPLIAGVGFLLPIAEVTAVIWLVGVGARLIGAHGLVTVVLQLVAFAMSITGVSLSSGIGGVVPGPAAVAEAAQLIDTAWDQIMTTVPPVPPTAEITLFATIAVGALAIVVDLLIAATHTPALIGLPLLGLYSVPAAIAPDLLPWYAFAAPTALYVAVLFVAARRPGRGARATIALALTAAVLATGTIALAALGTEAASGIGTNGRLPHSGRSTGEIGLSTWVRLRGELTDSDPVDVLTVTGLSSPTYLRTVALEKWEPDTGFTVGPVTPDVRNIDGALPDATTTGPTSTVTVVPQHLRDKYLPLYLDATAVGRLSPGWNYDTSLDTVYRDDATTPGPYEITRSADAATTANLRADSIVADPALTDDADLPAQVADLARTVTAGATTDFDKVDALLKFFTDPANGFTYSLSTPTGNSGSAIVDFLTERQGYCEQYAAAMAIMVRSLGIPARVGIGFTQGTEQADGSYQITSTDAHAWVEVPFRGAGWVTFDPTPAVDGQGGLQGFTDDAPETSAPASTTAASATGTSAGAPATTSASATTQTLTATTTAPADGSSSGGRGRQWTTVALVAAIAIVLAAMLAAPSTVRALRRRRRLALAARGGYDGVSAAWSEVVDSAVDRGVDLPRALSARAVAHVIATRAELSRRRRQALDALVDSAEERWYSPAPTAAPGHLDDAARQVVTGIARRLPLRGIARLWPRSFGGRR